MSEAPERIWATGSNLTGSWNQVKATFKGPVETEYVRADLIEELEAKLAKAMAGLKQCEEEIDQYIWQEYPSDHPVHERYRKRDFSANPARLALAELKGETDE